MDKLEKEYISAMKDAVIELREVLDSDISFDKRDDEKTSKIRKEVSAKYDAFITARGLIQRCFMLEQDAVSNEDNELWYRKTMMSLIDSAEKARVNLIKMLKEKIDISADGDDIQNSIKIKAEVADDIESLNEGIRDLRDMLKKKELVIEKKKEFVGNFAEKYAEN